MLVDADENTHIAIVSAPSVYVALRNILSERREADSELPSPTVKLLEYDKRFEILGSDFVPYDFAHPLRLSPDLKGYFDRILVDPPFLSEDCQTRTALTVRYLAKDWSQQGLRLVACTGERMGSLLGRLYGNVGLRETAFEVVHAKGLSNEFRCWANFEGKGWGWRRDSGVAVVAQGTSTAESEVKTPTEKHCL